MRVVFGVPAACLLFGWFLSIRGYQSVIASRLILYSAAAILMMVAYTTASSFLWLKRVFQTILPLLVFAVAIFIDRGTLPNKASTPSVPGSLPGTIIVTRTVNTVDPNKPVSSPANAATPPPPRRSHFPTSPLLLVAFSSTKNGTIKNISDETLFVSGFKTSAMIANKEDSVSYVINKEIKPHDQIIFDTGLGGTWDTPFPYTSEDWDTEGKTAWEAYGGCSRPLPFTSDSFEFDEVVNHYKSMKMLIPTGDAIGTFKYLRGSSSSSAMEQIRMKTILFLQRGCTK
ncbi:MAG TPA: hypothetical protein VGU23_05740 [Acidobacteriaceae bacterium]|nr:hypothetical protein [Acidobacteriaceae bacterium]